MVHIEGVSRANFGCSILGNKGVKMQDKFGWICAKCSKSYSPLIWECKTCNNPEMRDPNQKNINDIRDGITVGFGKDPFMVAVDNNGIRPR